MVKNRRENNLVVIEDGAATVYFLDDKLQWVVGEPSKENNTDIAFGTGIENKQYGIFRNIDGFWFYQNYVDKHKVILNGRRILEEQADELIILEDGDVFCFCITNGEISKKVWVVYLMNYFECGWQIINACVLQKSEFIEEKEDSCISRIGKIIRLNKGIAICLGEYVWFSGEIR